MRIYHTTRNNGDGSSSTIFFKEENAGDIERLEDYDPETYAGGEGGSCFTLPDGTDISGISFTCFDEECPP